jgi:hypothetical protein
MALRDNRNPAAFGLDLRQQCRLLRGCPLPTSRYDLRRGHPASFWLKGFEETSGARRPLGHPSRYALGRKGWRRKREQDAQETSVQKL